MSTRSLRVSIERAQKPRDEVKVVENVSNRFLTFSAKKELPLTPEEHEMMERFNDVFPNIEYSLGISLYELIKNQGSFIDKVKGIFRGFSGTLYNDKVEFKVKFYGKYINHYKETNSKFDSTLRMVGDIYTGSLDFDDVAFGDVACMFSPCSDSVKYYAEEFMKRLKKNGNPGMVAEIRCSGSQFMINTMEGKWKFIGNGRVEGN